MKTQVSWSYKSNDKLELFRKKNAVWASDRKSEAFEL